jgi:alpha-methylacyl-CoA racemase
MMWGLRAADRWSDTRGVNVLDSGAPWYDAYATSDGRFFAVGAIEPKFYAELLQRLGLAGESLPAQHDREGWPLLRERFARVFAQRTRGEWERVFADSDACAFPVLSFAEAAAHPHASTRDSHVDVEGILQPAPAPRFSRTPGGVQRRPPERGAHGRLALLDWGFDDDAIARLRALGVGFA